MVQLGRMRDALMNGQPQVRRIEDKIVTSDVDWLCLQLLGGFTAPLPRVADKVGLERTHLYRKLKQLGIRPSGKTE